LSSNFLRAVKHSQRNLPRRVPLCLVLQLKIFTKSFNLVDEWSKWFYIDLPRVAMDFILWICF
jgi:hypothetical protein